LDEKAVHLASEREIFTDHFRSMFLLCPKLADLDTELSPGEIMCLRRSSGPRAPADMLILIQLKAATLRTGIGDREPQVVLHSVLMGTARSRNREVDSDPLAVFLQEVRTLRGYGDGTSMPWKRSPLYSST
jgi:hypothetical protein